MCYHKQNSYDLKACPAVEVLTHKVDTLSKEVETLKASNQKLQDSMDDLEYLQMVARYDNILADCVSSAYLEILKQVRVATNEKIYSCM